MAKTGIALAGFVVGLLVSAGAFVWVWIEFHPPTSEVWTSTTEIRLENGALIPAGSELIVDDYMPEGFVRIELAINVDGESLSRFDKRTEQARNLAIPYWVQQ
jgi:hypothetical protein